jgi:signal transduction histidine kinase
VLQSNKQTADIYNILIVDDDELVIESFDRVFNEYSHEFKIDKTTDSLKALELIKKHRYDLVVTDIVMPEVDGIQLLQKVKEVQPDAEVIIITAYSSCNTALDALHMGAFDYIPKPFNPSELKMKILKAVDKRKAVKERNEKIAEMERLIYTIAHDFRASILSIKGFTEILAQDYSQKINSEGKFLVYRINSNVATMESMIEGLLEYAKIGRFQIDWSNINTYELVREIAANFAPVLQERGIKLLIDPSLPEVYFYRNGLLHIFSNLIDNSIKYARPEAASYIKIGVASKEESPGFAYYLLYVEDNGIGIPQENLNIIFEIFQRGERGVQKKGYGIGLAIVKKILETAGCTIYAESVQNEKTSMYFTLPIKR